MKFTIFKVSGNQKIPEIKLIVSRKILRSYVCADPNGKHEDRWEKNFMSVKAIYQRNMLLSCCNSHPNRAAECVSKH